MLSSSERLEEFPSSITWQSPALSLRLKRQLYLRLHPWLNYMVCMQLLLYMHVYRWFYNLI